MTGKGSIKEMEEGMMRRLRFVGFKEIKKSDNQAYDVLVDGVKVELKHATPDAIGTWSVNIHRRGILNESQVDAYVICLAKLPGFQMTDIYLVMPAPVGRMTFTFSISNLLTVYKAYVNNWHILRHMI